MGTMLTRSFSQYLQPVACAHAHDGKSFCVKQEEVEDMAMKRREKQAEYDRVSEIHKARLESSYADSTDANTVSTRSCSAACSAQVTLCFLMSTHFLHGRTPIFHSA